MVYRPPFVPTKTARFGKLRERPTVLDELVVVGKGSIAISGTARLRGNIALTDLVTGQFRPGTGRFQQALKETHRRATVVIRKGQVDVVRASVKKRGRVQVYKNGNERLTSALNDDKNAQYTASEFRVNIAGWLDRSPAALYYRQIEHGVQQSFQVKGLFTDNFRRWSGPIKGIKGPDKDAHLIQGGRKAVPITVRGYPRFNYVRGGRQALNRFDMQRAYSEELGKVGIPMRKVTRTGNSLKR